MALSKKWVALSAEERQKYIEISNLDRERYRRGMAEYTSKKEGEEDVATTDDDDSVEDI